MRLTPLIVGVDAMTIFLLCGELRGALDRQRNRVALRARARRVTVHLIQQRIADRPHGQARRRDRSGERDVPRAIGENLVQRRVVRVARLDRRDLPAQARRALNMGATRSFESALASSVRGSTTSTGPGSTSAMKPRKFSRTSVLIICARRQQHHLAARMGRAEHVHRLALVRPRAPLAPLGRRAAGQDAVLIGPLRDE